MTSRTLRSSKRFILSTLIILLTACSFGGLSDSKAHQGTTFFDQPPQPAGGISALMEKLVYPESAKAAGVEGRVVVQCYFDDKGRLLDTSIVAGSRNSALRKAAIDAVKASRFEPAERDGRPIAGWVEIPFTFRLSAVDDL